MTSAAREPDTRAFQRLVDHVQLAMTTGEIKPGDRLPSERDLGEQFGMARSSVREALRVLESMELVRSAPRDPRGPLVLQVSMEPVRRTISMLASTSVLDLPELIQFRMIADAAANLLAALRRTDAHLLAMERNMARMRASMDRGYDEFSRADLEFHEIIAEAGGNKLIQVYGDVNRAAVLDLIRRTILDAGDRTALMLQSVRHHRDVHAAISARDAPLASRLARESLYEYYGNLVGEQDRAVLAALVRDNGGTVPD
jgi:GntR family transcriptional regulator, transcriptional repressor for pyruvate dehydrogenase complex